MVKEERPGNTENMKPNEDISAKSIEQSLMAELQKFDDPDTMKKLLDQKIFYREMANEFFSLLFAGFTSKIMTGWLERIKLVAQTPLVWRANELTALKATSYREMIREIRYDQGVKSFWRGTSANVVKTIPASILRLGIYDQLKGLIMYKGDIYYSVRGYDSAKREIFEKHNCGIHRLRNLQLASLSTRENQSDHEPQHVTSRLARNLYRGYLFNSIVTIPSAACTLMFYDIYRDYLFRQGVLGLYSRYTLIGLVSTFTTQTILYPLDTVRRLIQADSSLLVSTKQFKNAKHCFKRVFAEEGVRGFYRGWGTAVIKTPFQTVLQLLTYEFCLRSMEIAFKYH